MRASLAGTVEQLLGAWPQLVGNGMPNDESGIRALASSGLVEFLWRNGPVEDAHASRRGPSDGQMMTMSIELWLRGSPSRRRPPVARHEYVDPIPPPRPYRRDSQAREVVHQSATRDR